MKTFCISSLACLISLMPTAQALSHHSSAAFDVREEVTVSGTILEYSFRNPHVYYYCVTNEAVHRTDNEEAAESGSGRCECEAWQSSRGYVVRAGSGVPRGLKCLGSLGTDSPTCSTNAEGEKRLRSATRNP